MRPEVCWTREHGGLRTIKRDLGSAMMIRRMLPVRTKASFGLAAITLLATLALLTLGGAVHATGSSLACPDWPTCYGAWMPPMVGGVLYEHGHRMLGTLVGVLTVALAFTTWRDEALARPALVLVAAVAIQGVLGGLTVLLGISAWVSILHLALAHAVCAGIVWVMVGASRRARVSTTPQDLALADLALVAVSGQILLGGVVRHLGAGLSCGEDMLRCAGMWFPTWSLGSLQMSHRAAAMVVVGVIVLVAVRFAKQKGLRPWALAALALTLAQVVLGLASVASSLAVVPVVAHLLCATLLFLILFVIRTRLQVVSAIRRVRSSQAVPT